MKSVGQPSEAETTLNWTKEGLMLELPPDFQILEALHFHVLTVYFYLLLGSENEL